MTPLQDDRRLLEEAQRVAQIGSFAWNPRSGEVRYTRELFRLFDLDPNRDEPLVAEEFYEAIHPDDRERVQRRIETSLGEGEPFEGFFRFAHDPSRIYQARVRFDRDGDGVPTTVWGTVQDITAQHVAAERRRLSEQRLEEAERLALLGSYDYGIDTQQLLWSNGMYLLMDVEPGTPMVGQDYLDLIDEEAAAVHTAHLYSLLDRGEGEYGYEYNRIAPDERRHWYAVRGELYTAGDGRHLRGSVQDITDRRRPEQQHAELAQLGIRALRHADLRDLYAEACTVILRTVECAVASVFEVRDDHQLELAAVSGLSPADPTYSVPRRAGSPAHSAFESRRTVVVENWDDEESYHASAFLRDQGIRSTVVVPLVGRAGPFGVVAAHARRSRHFHADDVVFLESLATLVASAIERMRAEAEVAELARMRGRLVADTLEAEERTRRRISEALHDGALQDLLAARQDLVEAEAFEVAQSEMLAHARSGVERAVAELRDAVRTLHPVVLQHGGLEAALRAAGDEAARRGAFTVDVDVADDATGLRDELVLSLARELLTNAAKHARATSVAMSVRRDGDAIMLEVTDDGVGADPAAIEAAPRTGHVGLASLTQRAEAIGGHLALRSAPGTGTTATARLPID